MPETWTDTVTLHPGWATRYASHKRAAEAREINFLVSGTASQSSTSLSVPQQALMRVARAAANLPSLSKAKLSAESTGNAKALAEAKEEHTNFEERIKPFLAKNLADRKVELTFYVTPAGGKPEVLATETVTTTKDGTFKLHKSVVWKPKPDGKAKVQSGAPAPPPDLSMKVVGKLVEKSQPPKDKQIVVNSEKGEVMFPVSRTQVRVISDIDDTIKLSNILSGKLTVFRTVFSKSLSSMVIKGMNEWYAKMEKQGVGFHYVSNSPNELISPIRQFRKFAKLPTGSVALKTYSGGSIVEELLSEPAKRKKASVLEVLTFHNRSKFILIGDSGEQDLELYAEIAREKPDQILAIFIRDARDHAGTVDIEHPLGTPPAKPNVMGAEVKIQGADKNTPLLLGEFEAEEAQVQWIFASKTDQRNMLQGRVDKARGQVPTKIPVRIFRDPAECIEYESLLKSVLKK